MAMEEVSLRVAKADYRQHRLAAVLDLLLSIAALSWASPWRREPNYRLRYWSNGLPADMKAEGFRTVLVYWVGPPDRDPPAAGTLLKCRWIDSRTGTGTMSAHI